MIRSLYIYNSVDVFHQREQTSSDVFSLCHYVSRQYRFNNLCIKESILTSIAVTCTLTLLFDSIFQTLRRSKKHRSRSNTYAKVYILPSTRIVHSSKLIGLVWFVILLISQYLFFFIFTRRILFTIIIFFITYLTVLQLQQNLRIPL